MASDPDRIAYFLKSVTRVCKEFDLLADGDRSGNTKGEKLINNAPVLKMGRKRYL